jgi:hypothetical protein
MRAPKESPTPRLGSARLLRSVPLSPERTCADVERSAASCYQPDVEIRRATPSRRVFSKADTIVDSLDRIDRFLTKWVVQR